MLTSAPILRNSSSSSINARHTLSHHQITNLEDYLRQINNTFGNLNLKLNRRHSAATAQSRDTLTRSKVKQIR